MSRPHCWRCCATKESRCISEPRFSVFRAGPGKVAYALRRSDHRWQRHPGRGRAHPQYRRDRARARRCRARHKGICRGQRPARNERARRLGGWRVRGQSTIHPCVGRRLPHRPRESGWRRSHYPRPLGPLSYVHQPAAGAGRVERRRGPAPGHAVRVAKLPIVAVLRSRTTSETRGFMKALVAADGDRILGFTMFGAKAGEVMDVVQTAMFGRYALHGLARRDHRTSDSGGGARRPLLECVGRIRLAQDHSAQAAGVRVRTQLWLPPPMTRKKSMNRFDTAATVLNARLTRSSTCCGRM